MNEKTMVADALTGVNGELKMFGDMIHRQKIRNLSSVLSRSAPSARCHRKSCIRSPVKKVTMFRQRKPLVKKSNM